MKDMRNWCKVMVWEVTGNGWEALGWLRELDKVLERYMV